MRIGENIKHLRKCNFWSQAEVGSKIGVTQTQIGAYERGESFPSFEVLLKLCEHFGVSLDALVFQDLTTEELAMQVSEPEPPMRLVQLLEFRVAELEREIAKLSPAAAEALGIRLTEKNN
jgi:transcriptional regulator with XRE-family HTH domain